MPGRGRTLAPSSAGEVPSSRRERSPRGRDRSPRGRARAGSRRRSASSSDRSMAGPGALFSCSPSSSCGSSPNQSPTSVRIRSQSSGSVHNSPGHRTARGGSFDVSMADVGQPSPTKRSSACVKTAGSSPPLTSRAHTPFESSLTRSQPRELQISDDNNNLDNSNLPPTATSEQSAVPASDPHLLFRRMPGGVLEVRPPQQDSQLSNSRSDSSDCTEPTRSGGLLPPGHADSTGGLSRNRLDQAALGLLFERPRQGTEPRSINPVTEPMVGSRGSGAGRRLMHSSDDKASSSVSGRNLSTSTPLVKSMERERSEPTLRVSASLSPQSRRVKQELTDYQVDATDIVGTGSFGSVLAAVHQPSNQKCVMKVLEKSRGASQRLYFHREIEALARIRSRYVPYLFGAFEDPARCYIAMERRCGVDLFTFLEPRPGFRLSEDEARKVSWQLVSALCHVHMRGVIHRDIKLENVLVTQDPDGTLHATLIDFGLCFIMPYEGALCHDFCGSLDYAPPEIVQKERAYHGDRADVWSLGVVIFILLFGITPFNRKHRSRAIRHRQQHPAVLFPRDPQCDPHAVHLIERMLDVDAASRADMQAVSVHPWFEAVRTEPANR